MDSRIRQSISFMEENLNSKLTERDLARKAGVTPEHFCGLFKTETDQTPMRYLNDLRMNKARELLESDDDAHLSVKEIADRVGCQDLSHFVRDFETKFKFSPSRYRAKYRSR